MLDLIQSIFEIEDSEKGGDHALNGFEFQQSTAIYLMFKKIELNKKAELIYEKLEDFIIVDTDEVSLYQAKSLSKNLTPGFLLTKKKDKPSIIDKMYNNYLKVRKKLEKEKITTTLIICSNCQFGPSLKLKSKEYDVKKINFDEFDNSVKEGILKKSNNDSFEWDKMEALKIIPKPHHEEVTRSSIVDIITKLEGECKVNCKALYDTLCSEIVRIRKYKETLSTEKIKNKIVKYSHKEDNLEYENVIFYLNDMDQKNIWIKKHFNILRNLVEIKGSEENDLYLKLVKFFKGNKIKTLDCFFDQIRYEEEFEDMFSLKDEDEIKALLLIVIGKEAI
ncbi:hypothetical protein PM10SUCC1_19130 [Propionigenium maris DSM 9537]|uniref:CD-NTase associated protein 4-like DNA endonuclease domain-containing protein n=1 Tax=Propionigenium maris DSM 9537 TaxID=1123000 RepID=A0A9W6GM76_9FUSO|nr:dsDNA nuclease domain-containing protein [Propionigenium maris]GLI56399.1 hypothetical protein PM10SUCC1_19130 [Propionigenium maris DSM 9537]